MRYKDSVEDRVHHLLSSRLQSIYQLFGQIPDVLEDVWIDVALGSGVTPSEARASLKRAKITIDFPLPKVLELSGAPIVPTVTAKPAASATRREAGKKARETMTAMAEATLPNLVAAGFVKPPLELERTYKGVRLTASIQPNGIVSFGSRTSLTLSAAGGIARKSVLGTSPQDPPPATNGWIFWQFRDSKTGKLREIDSLRQEFLASTK